MSERLKYVLENYLQNSDDVWQIPLFMAAVWVLGYPLLSSAVFWYWEKLRVWKEKIRMKLGGNTPYPCRRAPDVYWKKSQAHKDQYTDLLKQRDDKDTQVQSLISEVQTLKASNTELEGYKGHFENAEKHLTDRSAKLSSAEAQLTQKEILFQDLQVEKQQLQKNVEQMLSERR